MALPFDTATMSSRDDLSKRARKLYTITKCRESGTEPEHDKFFEAIQLYNLHSLCCCCCCFSSSSWFSLFCSIFFLFDLKIFSYNILCICAELCARIRRHLWFEVSKLGNGGRAVCFRSDVGVFWLVVWFTFIGRGILACCLIIWSDMQKKCAKTFELLFCVCLDTDCLCIFSLILCFSFDRD